MTLSEVSPADEYSVRPLEKTLQNKHRIYPAGAHHSDYPDMRRILKPGHTCRICRSITTPVAQKPEYSWFTHHNIVL